MMSKFGKCTQVHAGAAKDLRHAVLVYQRHGGGIVLRGVEKQRAARGECRKTGVKGIGGRCIIGEQRADFAPLPAAPDDAITAQFFVAAITQGEGVRLGNPTPQESLPHGGKAAVVVGQHLFERNFRQRHHGLVTGHGGCC